MQISAILKYVGLLTFGYIVLLAFSYSQDVYQPFFTLTIFALVVWIGKRLGYNTTKIFLGLLFFGGTLRFLWAVFIPSLPASDFEYFHKAALELSQGIPALTKSMGYTSLLSTGYRIYPAILTGKLINAFASTLSLVLLYAIAVRLGKPGVGLVAVFLFAILPSEINMVSVLGTEITATTVVLIVVLSLLYGIQSKVSFKQIAAIGCAGLFYGFGLLMRASLAFYFPIIGLGIFFFGYLDKFNQKIKAFSVFLLGAGIGVSIIVISYSLVAKQFSMAPLETQDSFPFLSGTNIAHSGQWSREDAELYFSWPADKRDEFARQEALRRIGSNPVSFLRMIPQKMTFLFAGNDYASTWSLEAIDWGSGNPWGGYAVAGENWRAYQRLRNTVIKINGALSQAVYCVIWFFALYAFGKNNIPKISWIILGIVLLTMLPHMIVETQSRYHHSIMPLVTLWAAYGLCRLSDNPPVIAADT